MRKSSPNAAVLRLSRWALYAAELVLFYCANLAHSYVRSQSAQKEAEDMSKINLTYFLGAIDVSDLAWVSMA